MKETIYSKLVMMFRKKEDKTFKYFQSCFWELYSENTDCNVQRPSYQSMIDLLHFCAYGIKRIIDCMAVW